MPGQRLMCIWETASMICPTDGQTTPTCHTLKALTITALRDCSYASYYSCLFEELFYEKVITLEKFKMYIRQCLDDKSIPFSQLEDEIEEKCWQQCKDLYTSVSSVGFEGPLFKQLWQIYLRLLETDSYPTVIIQQDMEWFLNHMASTLAQNAKQQSSPNEKMDIKPEVNFPDFLTTIRDQFSMKYDSIALKHAIEEMHTWLVLEISMAGWLNKRKRKAANWTGWLQRWFVLSPGKLTYYDSPKCELKKGEILVTSKSTLVEIPNTRKSIFKKTGYVLKLSNVPYIEMEMSTSVESEYKSWVTSIQDVIESSKLGSTQVQILLEKRRISQFDNKESKLREIKIRSSTVKRISRGWYEYDKTKVSPEPNSPLQILPSSLDDEGGNETINEDREKIRTLFNGCDLNGNGFIDRSEFKKFIKEFGQLDLDKEELDEVYDSIDRDSSDSLTFDEFYDYFIKVILSSSYETSFVENKLKMEFLKADQQGSSAVNFKELVEVTQEQQRNLEREMLEETFKELSKPGEDGGMPLEEFQHLLHADDVPKPAAAPKSSIERRLKSIYQKTEHQNMAGYIKERWNKFSSFKRFGSSGDVVMKGSSNMVADVLPGQYNLLDLACFSEKQSIEPKRVIIKGAKWVKSPDPGQSGMIIFPSDYDGSIPVDIATSEHARYYGCHLADSTQVKVSLLYRHGIQDFTYQNTYLNDYVQDINGPGLEMHEFSHLDCPLEDDSGYFILGKIVQGPKHEELHLTAFVIPTRHTLYVPGNTIHCNDYLKGTWRTMLSDEADIDHYNVVKRPESVHNSQPRPFVFKMTGRWAIETSHTTKL